MNIVKLVLAHFISKFHYQFQIERKQSNRIQNEFGIKYTVRWSEYHNLIVHNSENHLQDLTLGTKIET